MQGISYPAISRAISIISYSSTLSHNDIGASLALFIISSFYKWPEGLSLQTTAETSVVLFRAVTRRPQVVYTRLESETMRSQDEVSPGMSKRMVDSADISSHYTGFWSRLVLRKKCPQKD